MQEKLVRAVRVLNGIADSELGKTHRHRYNKLGCKPHPHTGPHVILCECGKAKGGRDMETTARRLTQCKKCNAWVDLNYGADSPSVHSGAKGTKSDPRSPGDWDDICDVCCYS